MADRRLVAEGLGDGERGLEAVECRVQIQLDAVRDSDPPEEGRGDRRLFRRAQLREGLLVELPCLLRPPLSLRQLGAIDQRRRRRCGAEQPRVLERIRQRLRRIAHAISSCADGTRCRGNGRLPVELWGEPRQVPAWSREGAAVHSTYDARQDPKVIGPAGRIPVWPDGYFLVRSVHPTAMI